MGLTRSLGVARAGRHSEAILGRGEDVFDSYGANQGIVSSDGSSVIIDSGFHNTVANQILRRVPVSRERKLFVLNTHYHSDHVFGNSVFAKAGAVVIAHEKCGLSMRTHSLKLLDDYRRRDPRLSRLLRGVEITYPTIMCNDGMSLRLDEDLNAEIIHPEGRAHTDGDSMVWVKEDRVLFAGDVVWVGYHPNLEDADIQGQVRALREIVELKPRRIVPGHGPVCGLGEVRRLMRYLEELDENGAAALKLGLAGARLVRKVIPSWSWGWRMRWLAESYIQEIAKSRA